MRGLLRRSIVGLVLLLTIINYFALTDIFEKLLVPIDNWLYSVGYVLDAKKPILFIFDKLIPAAGTISFVLSLSVENFKQKMLKIYRSITDLQLFICVIILPLFWYLQNHLLQHLSSFSIFKEREQ